MNTQEITVPLEVTAKKSNAEIKKALARLRTATDCTVTANCELAREARSSSASSQRMKAVRPNEPLPEGDVTQRFEAIRANIR